MSVGGVDDLLLAPCLYLPDPLHPLVHRGVDVSVKLLTLHLLYLTDQCHHLTNKKDVNSVIHEVFSIKRFLINKSEVDSVIQEVFAI